MFIIQVELVDVTVLPSYVEYIAEYGNVFRLFHLTMFLMTLNVYHVS